MVRRASRTIGAWGVVALLLASAGGVAAAPAKAGADRPSADKPAAGGDAGSPSWVADELRILRSEVESLRQRPDSSLASDLTALRAEVSKVANAQAELERRLGGVPASPASGPGSGSETGSGMSMTGATIFLGLGFALGWVGSQLSQRWRDRRQRIRL